MNLASEYSESIIERMVSRVSDRDLAKALRDAVRNNPRHLFIRSCYFEGERYEVTPASLKDLLPLIYEDKAIALVLDREGRTLSSNSQPSYIALMLSLLEVSPGMRVLEVGSGSGWIVALLADIVGSGGFVQGIDIIDSLINQSRETLRTHSIENAALQRLVDSIARVGGVSAGDQGIRFGDLEEEQRCNWGAAKVYGKLWELFELDLVLQRACSSKRREFDLSACVLSTVVARLMCPCSKLKVYERQQEYLGLKEVSLRHLYRALDRLADKKEEIESELFERQKDLFNMKVDVVLYDVTTLYFESTKGDNLKDFGYSKDAKFGEVQVVLGLLVDTEGRPIGFDLFPGNTFEGHTLIEALKKLRNRFQIRQVIIVADRGINSKLNLYAIKQAGFDYIVGTRLKNLKKSVKQEVLEHDSYQLLTTAEDGAEELSYQVLEHKKKVTYEVNGERKSVTLNEKLLCTWSKKRTDKDRRDREKLVERAKELLTTPSKVRVRRGPRRFISTEDAQAPAIDEAQIREDQKWDGLYGIQSSRKNLTPAQILDAYHALWKIEESFRVFKHTLQTRPVFHWTPKRIKGHLVTCFIALLLERTLELTLQRKKIDASPDKIREALHSLQVSKLKADNQHIYLTSKVTGLANHMLRALKLKIPKHCSESPPT